MKIKSFKIVCRLYPNIEDYVPQKNKQVKIKDTLYTVSHKVFLYDEGILIMELMR